MDLGTNAPGDQGNWESRQLGTKAPGDQGTE